MNFSNLNLQDLQLGHTITVNTSTGAATAMVKVPLPAGRNGFGPELSIRYSSSSRNSVFGMGWNLSGLPFISVDTKKGLPKYNATDQFAFNGSDSIVPQLVRTGTTWNPRVDENADFWIFYYRSKQENDFTRFERWVSKSSGETHWRTRSGNNTLSVYGLDPTGSTRIYDPENKYKTFVWMLESQFDDNGNAIQYLYKPENGDQVDPYLSFETNRLKRFFENGFSQKYPERIVYGNSQPLSPDSEVPVTNKWLFELVFDYGEYENRPYLSNQPKAGATWSMRPDPFSVYTPGFEIRTYRLCRRMLIFHHFDELSVPTSLTGIIAFNYDLRDSCTTLTAMGYTGVRRDLVSGNYTEKQLPELSFTYTLPVVGQSFKGLVRETTENIPQGFNQAKTRMIDLFGEGIPGILTESASNWYYKPNLGNGLFGRQEIIIDKPAQQMGIYSLGDFDQDGNLNLFTLQGRMAGYYEYDRNKEKWSGFTSFKNIPQVGRSKFIDLDSDGFPDLVVECDDKIICYPFKGKEGFGSPYEFAKPISGSTSYAPTLGDHPALDYFLADMTGDGRPDQVRIKNGRVEYYPNLGNGRFGEAVLMENAPVIDFDSRFDAGRLRLYDLDGSGTTDILYIGEGEIRYWHNASGNKFIEGRRITHLPYIDNISSAIIVDFLGTGTPCLVWSDSLNQSQFSALQYLELTSGIKPRLLISIENGMGREIQIEYGHSGKHYLKAKTNGQPWISKIPSHFTVAERKIEIDSITNTRKITEFSYRDGHYDGRERTFVTFGLVDQYDSERFENAAVAHDKNYARPSCTRTWLHNGMFGWDSLTLAQFYNRDPGQPVLLPQSFEPGEDMDADDFVLGYRSLAGKVIRTETYAVLPGGTLEEHPYHLSQAAWALRKLQPKTGSQDSCFMAYRSEGLTCNYDRNPDDPMVSHHLSLQVNPFGDIEKETSISYARRSQPTGILAAQSRDYITGGIRNYFTRDSLSAYHTGILYQSRDFEINHFDRNPAEIVKRTGIQSIFDGLTGSAIGFDQTLPSGGTSIARLVAWDRTYFWNSSLDAALPLGQSGDLVFAHHEQSACFNNALINSAFHGKVTPGMIAGHDEGAYLTEDGYWWQVAPMSYFNGSGGFFTPSRVEQSPGLFTTYHYDPWFLSIIGTTDAVGNSTRCEVDYNVVQPRRLVDQNDNISEVLYDPLGVTILSFNQGTVLDDSGTLQKYGNRLSNEYTRRNDETFDQILNNPSLFLQQADTFLFYDFDCWRTAHQPMRSICLTRENLVHDGHGNTDSSIRFQMELDYHDGFGRVIQSKRKVEPGPAIHRKADGLVDMNAEGLPILAQTSDRWLVTGHVVYNNKQLPVRHFEPFYSPMTAFENDVELESYGVSEQNYYDAVGRMVRTDFPDSTFTEVRITPWEIKTYDQNDTVDLSLYRVFRELLPVGAPERMALDRSMAHRQTPNRVQMDPLGREIVTIAKNNDGTEKKIENTLDIKGNIIEIHDARNILAFKYIRDMPGRVLYENSVDAGEKWTFHNHTDQTIHAWDGRNIHLSTRYDALDRIISVQVDRAPGLNQTTERYVYGEDASVARAREKNLRGQLVMQYDQAGIQELKLATPGGAMLTQSRRLLDQYTHDPDWSDPPTVSLDPATYTTRHSYDALSRPVGQVLPDGTARKFVFNPGGGVQKVIVSTADGVLNEVELLKNAGYNAKGLRDYALLGNDVQLDYTYDGETSRMKRLRARLIPGTSRIYQDIRYTYDPVGNLVYLIDESQQPAAPDSRVLEGLNVPAHSEFEYDALYQLKTAKGRVHQALLQNDYADRSGEAGVPANWGKGSRHITLNNGAAIERYTRSYQYDPAGNMISIRHAGVSQNWTRDIWTSATSNRSLPLTDLNGIALTNPENRFDAVGNCVSMPHLRSLEWNYRNQISKTVVIDRSDQGKPNDEEYYVYRGDGMRIRKITQRLVDMVSGDLELTEKIYLDGCEMKRITRGGTEILKRWTSQITDGTNPLALIHSWEKDTRKRETDDITKKKIHYQLNNHLGSSSLELDENGQVITFEEYFPFGGTSFIAGRNKRDIDLKEYRYSGKECDDFTGLYYFGYRYYAHWIGGWISPDPIGPEDSENLYLYVHNNPVNLVDPNGLQTKTGDRIGSVSSNLTESEAMHEFNSGQGLRLGIRITDLEKDGKNWRLVSYRPLTRAELQRYIEIQERFEEHPELAQMFTELEESMTDMPVLNFAEAMSQLTGSTNTGTDTGGNTTTGAGGEAADSTGNGGSRDTAGAGTNNGTGTGGNNAQTNSGGGGGNTGDGGTPSTGVGPSATGRGSGPGSGNGTGTGDGTGTAPAGGAGTTRWGQPGGTGTLPGGQPGGTGTTPGGQSGSTGTTPGGLAGRDVEGSEHGDPNGSREGAEDGTDGGSANRGPDGVTPGAVEGNGPGGGGNKRNGSGGGGKGSGSGNQGNGHGGPHGAGGINPDGSTEEPSWWERGLLAMAGAVYSVANIFVEAGKQVYDMVGLGVSCLGIATGWYEYDHEVASGIGLAAQGGAGTGDIFRSMGRGIIETPGRAWAAAEKGDWFSFGSESMNLYMLGRSAHGLAKGGVSFAFNRSVGALGRFGTRGIALRGAIRNWQVQRIAGTVTRRLGLPGRGLSWRYGGSSSKTYGSYSRSTGTITINEGSFTPGLLHRLPTGIFRGNYSLFSRLGISRLLRGRSSMTTPVHEGWHAVQHMKQPGWFNNIPRTKGNYSIRPNEFTQAGNQPMMGAHNYAFRFAAPSYFSIFFGLLGSANENTNQNTNNQ